MRILRVLLVAGALLGATPGAAQYLPQPPPEAPTAPPPYYPPPPPPMGPRVRPQQERYPTEQVANNVLRLSAGFSFLNEAYDCWYYAYGYGSCGYGYNAAFPNIGLETDLGISPGLALTIGANVMWGSMNGINNTIWEPHVDLLLRGDRYSEVRGRLRLGLGVYAAHASDPVLGSSGDTGAAVRLGAGLSFFNLAPVGLGLDVIFEAGSLGGYDVSTIQLMLGPELHF